jgi:hypothetical protein
LKEREEGGASMTPEQRRWLEEAHWRECDSTHWSELYLMPKWKILEVCWASLEAHPGEGFTRDGEVEMFDFRVDYLQRYFNLEDPNAYVDFKEAKQALLELGNL